MTQEYFCLPEPFAICEIGRKIRLNRRAIFRSMSDLCQVVRLIFGQICKRKNERIEIPVSSQFVLMMDYGGFINILTIFSDISEFLFINISTETYKLTNS